MTNKDANKQEIDKYKAEIEELKKSNEEWEKLAQKLIIRQDKLHDRINDSERNFINFIRNYNVDKSNTDSEIETCFIMAIVFLIIMILGLAVH